jgi:iron complex outermembrane receptor protein
LKILTDRLTAYAGFTQGFEDSGVAPNSAANRGAILPTSRTWQVDSGLRYRLTPKLNLITGIFEINKPYFNFDTSNVDRQLGAQRAKGLEISIAGQLAQGLNINAGGVLGEVSVVGPNLAAQGVGNAAIGQPHDQFSINLDYVFPKLPALSLDFGVYHFGAAVASVDGAAYDPQVTVYNLGGRYKFGIFGAPASLRMQIQNLTNVYIWNIGFNPGYLQFAPRSFISYLTVDL